MRRDFVNRLAATALSQLLGDEGFPTVVAQHQPSASADRAGEWR
jgi:hypothetical protein